jgi:hypothetical protein
MWLVDALNARSEAAGPGASGSRIHTWKMEDMSLTQSIWIGFCQIFIVFPELRAHVDHRWRPTVAYREPP